MKAERVGEREKRERKRREQRQRGEREKRETEGGKREREKVLSICNRKIIL
jgi:hypothetical protein